MNKLLLLGILIFFISSVYGQRRQHSIVTEREIKKRTLDVVGTYTTSIPPDVAYVSLLLETLQKTATNAYNTNNKLMKAVVDSLQASPVSIPLKQISNQRFTLTPEYSYPQPSNGGVAVKVFDGIKASQEISVKVTDLKKVSSVLDAALTSSSGKVQIISVDYGMENKVSQEADARAQAITDATEKARQICKATGTKLGKPLSIHEDDAFSSAAAPKMARSAAMYDGLENSPTIPQGQLRFQHTVYITFEILLGEGGLESVARNTSGTGNSITAAQARGSSPSKAAAASMRRNPEE